MAQREDTAPADETTVADDQPQKATLRGGNPGPIVTAKEAPEAGRKFTFTAQNGVTYGGVVLAVEKAKGGYDVTFTANGLRPE